MRVAGDSATSSNLHRPTSGPGRIVNITPEIAGWRYLSFAVRHLTTEVGHRHINENEETAIVPLSGAGEVRVGGKVFELSRKSVFVEKPHVLYVPPKMEFEIVATGSSPERSPHSNDVPLTRSERDGTKHPALEHSPHSSNPPHKSDFTTANEFVCSVGSAPAEGKLPLRLFAPNEMRSEIRGGGTAHRQVIHTLSAPLPAERLILYEVYVPRGTWAGWPPHCHDGRDGSPYLEEIYYFRLDREEGYAHHRNWRTDEGFDETLQIADGDVALVPKGFHTSVACPSANMYFLNYLAGDLVDEARATPPCFAAEHTWIESDWTKGEWSLPILPT